MRITVSTALSPALQASVISKQGSCVLSLSKERIQKEYIAVGLAQQHSTLIFFGFQPVGPGDALTGRNDWGTWKPMTISATVCIWDQLLGEDRNATGFTSSGVNMSVNMPNI